MHHPSAWRSAVFLPSRKQVAYHCGRARGAPVGAPSKGNAKLEVLLKLSGAIDRLNQKVSVFADWLVLLSCLISAGNAFSRYSFSQSSNAWLEIQWYLFSAVFLLCSGYALLHNQHVRIDIISGRLSRRARVWIDILGALFFLMPMAVLILWLSWPVFIDSR